MAFLWSIFNIFLVKFEIHFHFGYHATHLSARNLLQLVTFFKVLNLIVDRLFLQSEPQNYYMSPNPCLGSGYETISRWYIISISAH